MRAQMVLAEIGSGVRRNLTMTLAVVVTVATSLALLGAAMLIGRQVHLMKNYWYDKVEVSVFLDTGATAAQKAQLATSLRADPLVQKVYFEDRAAAFSRFRQEFRDSPSLVADVSPDQLPESYRVKLRDPRQFAAVAAEYSYRPGVSEVQDQRKLLSGFFRVLHGLQSGALWIALAQAVVALVLIYNTMRVAAFSRRRETGIMRLVGASRFSIQLPFLAEGALAGLLGAALACGALVSLKVFLVDHRLRHTVTAFPLVGWQQAWDVVAVVLVGGVASCVLASFVTLRRHLRV